MKIQAVIGSNFGDEGKGLTTDYLSSPDSLVIRFNGGAQAGHTVVSNGFRHVFHHFCAGTLVGAQSYLSEYFISNPIVFVKELKELENYKPVVYISPLSLLTTPYDMMINELVEKSRENKHGSCGLGINETVVRNKMLEPIFVSSITRTDFKDRLDFIRKIYVHDRLKSLSIFTIPDKYQRMFDDNGILEHFLSDCKTMMTYCSIVDPIIKNYSSIVFEGAQGLLLDRDNATYFPHVTNSNTGIKNVVLLMKKLELRDSINIYYVTRTYMTRHGAGQFFTETVEKPFNKIEDATNIPNEFQGTLRFGTLDILLLKTSIENDLKDAKDIDYTKNVMLTCLDQCETGSIISDLLHSIVHPDSILLSHSPTKETVKKVVLK